MARYYLDLNTRDGPSNDDHGVTLDGKDALLKEVCRLLLDVARDDIGQGEESVLSVRTRDEAGQTMSVTILLFHHEWLEPNQDGADVSFPSPW